eukprot:gene23014-29202_t
MLAMILGLFVLLWILFILFKNGLSAINWAMFTESTPAPGQLRALFVHSDARGRGVGQALLSAVMAKERGPLSLNVAKSNTPAVGFYEKFGFAVAAETTRYSSGTPLRLYQPASGQWTLHFASLANGLMTEPMHGSFKDGKGSFYGQDTVNGRVVLVRFLILPAGARQWRFEQAYSADGGQRWETNWIAIDTLRKGSAR